jgi:hypothetical protein
MAMRTAYSWAPERLLRRPIPGSLILLLSGLSGFGTREGVP